MRGILEMIIAKNNELESMKQYIADEIALNIIKAKQDTLDDVYKMVKSEWSNQILNIGD